MFRVRVIREGLVGVREKWAPQESWAWTWDAVFSGFNNVKI